MNLKAFSNEKLLEQTRVAVDVEKKSTTNVVRHFVEIFTRDLYLTRGYSSMFLMARDEFGYDKSSAQRRVNAMLLAIVDPSVLERIERSDLCLQAAADIQTFLNAERARKNAYTEVQTRDLVNACAGMSAREVQIKLADLNPDLSFRESKRFVAKDRLQITYTTSAATESKLDRIKELRSHVDPYMSREQLLDFMAEIVLGKIDPVRKDERAEKRDLRKTEMTLVVREEIVSDGNEIQLAVEFEEPRLETELPAQGVNRFINANVQRQVRKQNENRGCEFIDGESGRECGSKHQLQFDHITEFAKGGSNDAANLRMLCAKHNRFTWRQNSTVRAPFLAYG